MGIKRILYFVLNSLERKKRLKKYSAYKIASTGDDMYRYIDWVKAYTNVSVNSIFEIGANYAQDAEVLAKGFGVDPHDIYVFEAHPQICKVIKQLHPHFNCFNNAVFNENKEMMFNLCDITSNNSGCSSLKSSSKFEYQRECCVEAIRMDTFMKEQNINSIDFCKIDVEGCGYEVLHGFGDRINDVAIIQIEGEHEECWQGQHLYEDIERLLVDRGFELLLFERHLDQSDSLWVNKKMVRTK